MHLRRGDVISHGRRLLEVRSVELEQHSAGMAVRLTFKAASPLRINAWDALKVTRTGMRARGSGR